MTGRPRLLPPTKPEDPLAHLPCSTIVAYRKGETIFGPEQPSRGVCLIVNGTVSVSCVGAAGRPVTIDIYKADEFFGESCLLDPPRCTEQATALEDTKLMIWAAAEIAQLMAKRPRLGIAFAQVMARRSAEFGRWIASYAADHVDRRLGRTLLRMADRLGTSEEDGAIRLAPLTHAFLSQCVGTSREVVTELMIEFRRQGFLRYSRRSIIIHAGAFRRWLRLNNSPSI